MQQYSFGQTILEIKNVSLEIDGKLILRDINSDIKNIIRPGMTQGQIVGILGKSGAGKTQLFKLIAGLNKPTTGTILINEKPVKAGDVGVVAQNYPLLMHRTIIGNLQVAAKKNKRLNAAERKDKIDWYLTKFKLTDKVNVYPAQLSGGQKQRIAIIQQLLCSEHFLLLDEPFSGLDVNMINQCSEVILEVANLDELNTLIIVSHDYSSTVAVSDNLWFLGFDFDESGNALPGARIKYVDNLMKKGLTWKYPQVLDDPSFLNFTKDVRKIFNNL